MQTEYKYRRVITDDVANTTTVVFNIYNGEFADVEFDDVDYVTKQPKKVTKTIFQRTTPFDEPLEQHTYVFDGILTDDELAKNMNKIVKDLVKGKAYDNLMISGQDVLPTKEEEKVIKSQVKNK